MHAAPALPPDTENPWYLRPFFGRTPVLPADCRRTLGVLGIALGFENYDVALLNAALPEISADLGFTSDNSGFYLGAIRLGGIATFLLLPFADRIGRRRVMLAALVGMSVGTLLSGLSQTAIQFTGAQMFTRVFMLMAIAMSIVIVVEEFPAEQRGAGLGLLTLLGGLGFGFAVALYPAIDVLPFGWRSLYVIGIAPVLMLPYFRRSLKETRRFEAQQLVTEHNPTQGWFGFWLHPMLQLFRSNPRRTTAVGLAAFLTAMGGIATFQYTSQFVQEAHGWSKADFSMLVLCGGLIGVTGSIAGGRGSDRFGRRRVGASVLMLGPLAALLFYSGPAATLILGWGAFVFCTSAGDVVIRALSAELFATSHRSTSTGWMMLVQTFGGAVGLFLVGLLTEQAEDLAGSILVVSVALAGGGLMLLAVPETRHRELEDISKDAAVTR